MSDKEYIERGAALKEIAKSQTEEEAWYAVYDTPAADVEKVVRCKDCEYATVTKNGLIDCSFTTALRKPNFYCERGRAHMDGRSDEE